MKLLNRKIYALASVGLSLVGMVACGSNNSSAIPVVPINGVYGGIPTASTTCPAGTTAMNGSCVAGTDFSSVCYNSGGSLVQDASNQQLCKHTLGTSASYLILKPIFSSSPYLYSGAASNVGEYLNGININQGDTVRVLSASLSSISISGNSDLMLGLNDQVIDAEVTQSIFARNAGQLRIGVSTPSTKAGMHIQVEVSRCQTATAAFQCP
ncbi:MAG: hypothetical protein H7222_09145 [Methylotenera sp.]|nr:hypothetical protein [Oligoflexia bacterium]